jgi:putative PIN family toxin of toxin-antitoxin system
LRVSLDTNVLVSAFTTRGICADVLAVVLAEHQLVLGEKVLTELRRVLRNKMRMPQDEVAEAEAFLRQEAAVVSQGSELLGKIRDPDDAEVLAQAIEGLADVLVTGDRDLLDVTDELPVEVLSPRGFWEKLHDAS